MIIFYQLIIILAIQQISGFVPNATFRPAPHHARSERSQYPTQIRNIMLGRWRSLVTSFVGARGSRHPFSLQNSAYCRMSLARSSNAEPRRCARSTAVDVGTDEDGEPISDL